MTRQNVTRQIVTKQNVTRQNVTWQNVTRQIVTRQNVAEPTLRLMFDPLAVGKADMVCLIVASGIPCWPVALSLKIEWVDTPAC